MQNSDTKPRDKTSQNDQAVAKADAENNSPENLTSRHGKRSQIPRKIRYR